jgi:hypothetical protein
MIMRSELPVGYYVNAGDEPGYENLTVEVHAPDGIMAILSLEEGDLDVMVRWPLDPTWERARIGTLKDVTAALEYAASYLRSFKKVQSN